MWCKHSALGITQAAFTPDAAPHTFTRRKTHGAVRCLALRRVASRCVAFRCECGFQLSHSHRWIFGRPFVKRFALCYRTVVCLSCLSVSEMETGRVDGRRLPVGSGYRSGRVGIS